jgi:murein DD-endopeptidase MepM/ murein hydrolase activator NlpD
MVYSKTMKKLTLVLTILMLAAGCAQTPAPTASQNDNYSDVSQSAPVQGKKVFPIADADKRVTKKMFGTYVTPQNSPVSPEKFTGYHTGVDFETFPEEKDVDVPVYAICDGKVMVAKYVGGYGGAVIQQCQLNGQPITVIYGHLNLNSIKNDLNKQFRQGDQLAILGAGYSYDTAGERKHLHLGVHKGSGIEYRGYVQNKSELSSWLNYLDQNW